VATPPQVNKTQDKKEKYSQKVLSSKSVLPTLPYITNSLSLQFYPLSNSRTNHHGCLSTRRGEDVSKDLPRRHRQSRIPTWTTRNVGWKTTPNHTNLCQALPSPRCTRHGRLFTHTVQRRPPLNLQWLQSHPNNLSYERDPTRLARKTNSSTHTTSLLRMVELR